MAYMNQEKKAAIAAELKKVMPKGWKYSLRVRDYTGIVMTISAAPIDLLADVQWYDGIPRDHTSVNAYHVLDNYKGQAREVLENALNALNLNNYDNSDSMTDYFDVGHYVYLNIGDYNRPFVNTTPKAA